MSITQTHYNRKEIAQALRDVGVKRGDVVFTHSNVGFFGLPEEGRTAEDVCATILGGFHDVITETGTLVAPTFSYSFCRGEPFDPEVTPSTCGTFSEMLRKHPKAFRSHDPIFSVAALGQDADALTRDVCTECFGSDSFWARLLRANGIVCNLNLDAGSTFIHYAEQCLEVPYRNRKLFTGDLSVHGLTTNGKAIFFCRDLSNPASKAAFEPFDRAARTAGLARSASVGRGAIVAIRAADAMQLIALELERDEWFLTVSAKSEEPSADQQPSSGSHNAN